MSSKSLRSWAVAGSVLLAASGCGGIEFDVEIESETVVERGTLLEQFLPMAFDRFLEIDLAETQEFRNEDVDPKRVKSLRITSFVLEAVDPPGADLSFLRSIQFQVDTEGLPRQRIAYSAEGAFSAGESRVELELEDVELQPYATAESFSLTSEVTASRRPSVDTTVKGSVVFRVRAGF